jgi:rhodanese-related sulfurtransferase
VHCQTGPRAQVAISLLQANGFPDVRHLEGDFRGWSERDRSVDRPEPLASAAS